MTARDAKVFGPEGSIAYGRRVPALRGERFVTPRGVWPTDHKGLWGELTVKR